MLIKDDSEDHNFNSMYKFILFILKGRNKNGCERKIFYSITLVSTQTLEAVWKWILYDRWRYKS